MLAPGDPGDLTQVIDSRDLAAFLLDGVHASLDGVFNLTGTPRPFGILLDLCRTATYSDADLTWVPSDRLVAAGVDPGMGIPLWVAEAGYEAFKQRGLFPRGGRRAGLPADHRDDPLLRPGPGPGGPKEEGLDPVYRGPAAGRAGRLRLRRRRGYADSAGTPAPALR